MKYIYGSTSYTYKVMQVFIALVYIIARSLVGMNHDIIGVSGPAVAIALAHDISL